MSLEKEREEGKDSLTKECRNIPHLLPSSQLFSERQIIRSFSRKLFHIPSRTFYVQRVVTVCIHCMTTCVYATIDFVFVIIPKILSKLDLPINETYNIEIGHKNQTIASDMCSLRCKSFLYPKRPVIADREKLPYSHIT